jgi:hypothetical protein
MRDDPVEGTVGNEAEIQRPWDGQVGLRLELAALDVQVDLLAAEAKRRAAVVKRSRASSPAHV